MTPQERETMQMALDVLDDINQCSLPPTGIPLPAEIDEAMDSLRAALAQPEQEPVAYDVDGTTVYIKPPIHNGKYLTGYTAPPQREWQGLTDEERKEIIRRQKDFWGPVGWELECAKAIEAKLREKNFDRPS